MPRLTLEIDIETEERLQAAARRAGVSGDSWAANAIREKLNTQWPESVRRLAGAWKDLPEAEEIRDGLASDTPRETI
ncbi:MAG: hypothetical protein MI919_06535 [Holophagales bacterium]|nr:hypothetical protein [Holophagales bacterium]